MTAALVMLITPALDAQAPAPAQRRSSPTVTVGKWVLLGAAVALGVYALRASTDAADAYDELRALCLAAPTRCDHEGGAYADREAEALYDRALGADRQAQLGIYGGEAALLGSVALFIVDLRAGGGPPTIPYPTAAATGVRLTLLSVGF